jgi:hypothetical protein
MSTPLMGLFLWSILQVDKGMTIASAFSWYLELSSKKLILFGLAID